MLTLYVDASDEQAVNCPLAGEDVESRSPESAPERQICLVERLDSHSACLEKPKTRDWLQDSPSFPPSPSFPC